MAVPFLLLFALSEWLYHQRKAQAEITRKLVHIGTGLLTLLFPVVFQFLWQVIVICAAFLFILLFSLRYHFLPSINAVGRTTLGSVLFPVVVIIIFAFYVWMKEKVTAFDALAFFYLPILIMAIADPVAAFAGNTYKQRKQQVSGKTIIGSFAFFSTAFFIATILLFMFSTLPFINLLLYAVLIALTTTMAEKWSNKGWDNFTIPLSAAGLLYLIA